MKITQFGLGQTPPPSRSQGNDALTGAGSEPSTDTSLHGYSPSPELTQLIDLVRAQPEVREERVQAVLARLKNGHYSSPASAQAAATALLNDMVS